MVNGGASRTASVGGVPVRRSSASCVLCSLVTVAVAVAGGTPVTLAQQVWYVDAGATGGQTGTSWNHAFTDLQDALDIAQAGDEVRVAQGTYWPDGGSGDRAATFQLVSGVVIRGGHAGDGAPDPDERDVDLYVTVLSGQIGDPDSAIDNSYHVVTGSGADATAVLDGFTIREGQADVDWPDDRGGGLIVVMDPAPTVSHCRFVQNRAQEGGGLHTAFGAAPTIGDCLFLSNVAAANGGGVFDMGGDAAFVRCTFEDNHADVYGGAIAAFGSTASYTDCTIEENSAEIAGGGLYDNGGTIELDGCTFRGNVQVSGGSSGSLGGGGMFTKEASPTLIRCTFIDNVASDVGGAIFSKESAPQLSYCSILDNLAGGSGGGIYGSEGGLTARTCRILENAAFQYGGGVWCCDAVAVLVNCTLSGNTAYTYGGGVFDGSGESDLTSCILWGNSDLSGTTEDAQIYVPGGGAAVNYCCIQGLTGGLGGIGNTGGDPLFVDPDGPDGIAGTVDDDLRLSPGSSCISAGDPDFEPEPAETDLAGYPRPLCTVEIGAYEYEGDLGDFSCDGVINASDLEEWEQCATGPQQSPYPEGCELYDFNLDNRIDLADFGGFQRAVTPP